MPIHILYEMDDEDPDAVMATDDETALPAMLEAWLERHALARFGGMGEDAKGLVRKNLTERIKLGRAGPLTPIPGGLTYTRVGLFKAPTEGAAS